MNLQSGKLYWNKTITNPPSYEPLEYDIECDVLIIGGGTSGAQTAYYLWEKGLNVVLVDKGKIGQGSTSSNTALIQYSGDKMFYELINSFGEEIAATHLKLCLAGINEIEEVCRYLDKSVDFVRRDSLYYASYKEDVIKIEKEYKYLKKHGFDVELMSENDIKQVYPFEKAAAIYTKNDAVVNPYKFTLELIHKAYKKGIRVFEDTHIIGKKVEKDHTLLHTKNGGTIKTRYVIVAAGYECKEFKQDKNVVFESSYAVVTNQVEDLSDWHKQTLIWETARPYIYMRTTADNRIIIGGLDETTTIPEERDSKLTRKKDLLIGEFNKLFPNIKVSPEFYLSAIYGGTHDGLPMIGSYGQFPNWYFLMAYGDNGMVYSMVLARIITDLITKGSNSHLDIYLQNRPLINK
ncbi:FAD-dependent oxidoreductase [Serpentinicella sp. ANB-PHB4]|uniref:NAD(P)/FAD-dependent oxidoreductase n=1 Tax=Serpentinicella sp. ANB-PHB4 TaxID=3074076 RepID=UPI00285742DA|nr:FAD-dependent oxidoreductase [Serpentinicella sp. ANB-PHB4]MDR5658380.1 FAD-dependent oxidoreductase [Serpentinicella sp. ANB-PHB4]